MLQSMSEEVSFYVILGLSSNNVIESLIIQGYDSNDAHYYIMENYPQFADHYPFIHRTLTDIMEVYKKQYKMDPNLANFKELIDNSYELGRNFIKILELPQQKVINACSYYKNNKKTLSLKPPTTITMTSRDLMMSSQPPSQSQSQPQPQPQPIESKIQIKPKIEIKPKISLGLKRIT